jgi:tetratricopeptide (TPR) repeat protein
MIKEEEPPKPSTRLSDSGEALASISANRHTEPAKLTKLVRGELDWIVMKALEKDRNRRYETANGLARDVQRYLADEPVLACPPSAGYRLGKFVRRNQRALTTVAVGLVAALVLVGSMVWAWHDQVVRRAEGEFRQAQTEKDLGKALAGARDARALFHNDLRERGGVFKLLNNAARWQSQIEQAKAALGHVEAMAARAESPIAEELLARKQELQALLKNDEAERQLALDLEEVRLSRTVSKDLTWDHAGADQRYHTVFKNAGLDVLEGEVSELVKRIRESAISEQLVAALDDWGFAVLESGNDPEEKKWKRLLKVVRQADPGPWQDRIRGLDWLRDVTALEELAAEAPMAKLSPQMLVLVGEALRVNDLDAASWLRQAKYLQPSDFWINMSLGGALPNDQPAEAAGYYHAALAVRETSATYNNLGVVLHRQKKWSEMEVAYRKAINLQKDFASAYVGLGTALAKQKKLDEAEKHFRHAIQLKPNHPKAYFNLGIACTEQNKLAEAESSYRKAIELLKEAVKVQMEPVKEDDEVRKEQAVQYQKRKLLELQKEMAGVYYNLGNNLGKQDKFADAETALRQAVELNPEDGAAHNNLGTVLLDQQKLDEAEMAYRSAIGLKEEKAHFGLGLVLLKQQKFADAEHAFGRAIQLQPDHADAHHNLGTARFKQKKLPEAEKALLEVTRLKPDHPNAYIDLGVVYGMQNKLTESEAALSKAVKLNPASAEGHFNLGNAFRQQKKLAEAVTAYRKATRLKEDFALAHCYLGLTLRDQGHLPEALKHLRTGHQLGSQPPGWKLPSASWVRQVEQLLAKQPKLKNEDRKKNS